MTARSAIRTIKNKIVEEKGTVYSIFATVLISSVIIFGYRDGTLGDANYYISNGDRLLGGENVYADGFRSGPLGAIFLYMVSVVFVPTILEVLLQLCNIIGPILFVTLLFEDKRNTIKYWPILITFSAFRELLVNHQINGLILILLSVFLLTRKSEKVLINLVGNFDAAFALDLKPHLVIPILLSMTIFKKDWVNLLKIAFITTMLHIAVNLHLGTVTEIQWIQNLRQISSAPQNSDWADIFNVWPLFDQLINSPEVLKVIALSTFLALCLALPTISRRYSVNIGVYMALATPLIGVYAHFYDLVPFLILSFLYLEKHSNQTFIWFFVNCAVIFRGIDTINELIFLIVVNTYFLAIKIRENPSSGMKIIRAGIIGFALYVIYHACIEILIGDENLLRSFLISFIGFATFISTIKKISSKKAAVK